MSTKTLTVVITAKHIQASGIAVLDFALADGTDLPVFDAGAHIDVHISDNLIRQYSLCNDPSDRSLYRIGVLNDPNSRGGSKAIFEDFTVGQTVTISVPRNLFPLDITAKHSILFGGGIGITPLLSMAYTLRQQGKSFAIHYSCSNPEKAGFLNVLHQDFAMETTYHFSINGDDHRVKPQDLAIDTHDNTHVYVCGPQGYMDWVIDESKAGGISENNIHYEYFNVAVETGGDSFEVVAELSGLTLQVPADKTIVDVLMEAGIDIEKSCEQGICGTCLCDVLEGTPEHRDQFLTDDEKEDNDQIITCCSRAKTDRLVLEI